MTKLLKLINADNNFGDFESKTSSSTSREITVDVGSIGCMLVKLLRDFLTFGVLHTCKSGINTARQAVVACNKITCCLSLLVPSDPSDPSVYC